jgi:uncharacterized protein (DUF362 family)
VDSVALVKHTGDMGVQARLLNLEKAFEMIDVFGNLKSPLIIKPNIGFHPSDDLDRVKTTNVDMVEAFLKFVLQKNKGLSVKIVESDSMEKDADAETFKKFGYKSLMEKMTKKGFDVSLINLSKSPTVKVKFDGLFFKELDFPKILTKPGYFVSIAVAKTHPLTCITGVIKNLFGLLPKKNKKAYHPHINKIIVDLNRLLRPDLCIVDAITGLQELFDSKSKRPVNAIIVGKEPVSVDSTMARIMGFSPEKIRHLVTAEKYGLGSLNPKIVGEKLENMIVKFKFPSDMSANALYT